MAGKWLFSSELERISHLYYSLGTLFMSWITSLMDILFIKWITSLVVYLLISEITVLIIQFKTYRTVLIVISCYFVSSWITGSVVIL